MIAVTGGIGSGKTTALNIIKELGYPVFSCDDYVKNAYNNPEILKKLKEVFPSAFNESSAPDKTEISRLCFSNDNLYSKLTEIVSMPVFYELLSIAKETAKAEKTAVFVEVPLLFEHGLQKHFNEVIVITRPLDSRIKSVMARSNLSREQVIVRMKKQTDYDNADLSPYAVIVNDKNVSSLKTKIINALNSLLK